MRDYHISFEYIPEHFVGDYPCIVVKIKESQLTSKLRSEICECLKENISAIMDGSHDE